MRVRSGLVRGNPAVHLLDLTEEMTEQVGLVDGQLEHGERADEAAISEPSSGAALPGRSLLHRMDVDRVRAAHQAGVDGALQRPVGRHAPVVLGDGKRSPVERGGFCHLPAGLDRDAERLFDQDVPSGAQRDARQLVVMARGDDQVDRLHHVVCEHRLQARQYPWAPPDLGLEDMGRLPRAERIGVGDRDQPGREQSRPLQRGVAAEMAPAHAATADERDPQRAQLAMWS